MTTITLKYGKGYAGKLSNKCWVARIQGSDPSYGLCRRFLEPSRVEREHFNRPRSIIRFTYELAPDGLYECSECGDRWFVAYSDSGELKNVSDERLQAWVRALDAGMSPHEARQASLVQDTQPQST